MGYSPPQSCPSHIDELTGCARVLLIGVDSKRTGIMMVPRPSFFILWALALTSPLLVLAMIYGYSAPVTPSECISAMLVSNRCTDIPSQEGTKTPKKQRALVIYSLFVDLNASTTDPSLANLKFFTSTAIEEDPNIEYVFIMAADNQNLAETIFSNLTHPVWSYAFPPHIRSLSNVHLYWMPNGKYDLCNYSILMSSPWFIQNFIRFSKYFFLNTTVRGPLIHPALYERVQWLDIFLDRFGEREDVAAVGTTFSCRPRPHIQSYTLAVDRRGLEVANNTWFCPPSNVRANVSAFTEWVEKTEVGFSANIVSKNYTFLAIASEFLGMSGKETMHDARAKCTQEDPNVPGKYHKWYISPYDAIFFKSAGDVARYRRTPPNIKLELEVATEAVTKASARKKAKPRIEKP